MSATSLDEPHPGAARRQRVLVADSDDREAVPLSELLSGAGYLVDLTRDGSSVLAALSTQPPDVLLVDMQLPGQNGIEVCRRIRQNSTTRLLPIILMGAAGAHEQRIEGLEAGADEVLARPVNNRELLARVRSLLRMKQYTDDLDSASAILTTLASMIEGRDGNAAGHCSRMAHYATTLGRALGVSDDEQQVLYRGAFLHDVGMLAISDFVLRKPGPLVEHEFELVKAHTILGDELCANLRSLQAVRPIVRWHHERLDGSGYPDGLRGDQIPVTAQIVGIVDVFEAVTNERPYQRKRTAEEAIEVLSADVVRGWRRADLVELFASIMRQRATRP